MVTRPHLVRDEPAAAHPVRALRGAITVAADDATLIREATVELLRAMLARNGVQPAQLVSAIFTVTPNITRTTIGPRRTRSFFLIWFPRPRR